MQKKGPPWGYIVPAIILVIVIGGLIFYEFRTPVSQGWTPPPPGNYSNFPYPCLAENVNYHIHPYLTISINGNNVTIPAGIGIENPAQDGSYNGEPYYGAGANSCFEPVHTHDDAGIIHLESGTDINFTLGTFFRIWAATYSYAVVNGTHQPIIFNSTDILGYKVNSSSDSLKLLVDGGTPPTGDFQGGVSYGNLVLNVLDYCSSSSSSGGPCESATGDPLWNGAASAYPYGTGHTIVIEYTSG